MIASTPRRQQWRRLGTAAARAARAIIALVLAAIAAQEGYAILATALGAVATALALASRRSLRLAARSRVGAASEELVRRALASLGREGWRVRHSLDWPGHGDLDHVVRAPSGVGFMVETKTLRFERAHVTRAAVAARWLARRRYRYPGGVRPVICLARARHVERVEGDVLVLSLDRLVPALRRMAMVQDRPQRQRGRTARFAHAIRGTRSGENALRPPPGPTSPLR